MTINFVGLFNAPGYVGEVSDETHIARELEKAGNIVRRIPRDEWREFVIEEGPKGKYKGVPEDLKADINLVAKWHQFFDGGFIRNLAEASKAPVFLWVWDFMHDGGFPDWHIAQAKEADLLLSGEAGIFHEYVKLGIKPYYFQMDVCDGDIEVWDGFPKEYDVIFTGSCIDQGHRKEWLPIINASVPVKVFAWNFEEWKKLGLDASPAVYGSEYNQVIAKSKIVLGMSVEPNCWGYWSNRVGKVIKAGGFLLQEYAPGMETQLPDCIDFFNSPDEAIRRIKWCLQNEDYMAKKREKAMKNGFRFTSSFKVKQLTALMNRYLRGEVGKWNQI